MTIDASIPSRYRFSSVPWQLGIVDFVSLTYFISIKMFCKIMSKNFLHAFVNSGKAGLEVCFTIGGRGSSQCYITSYEGDGGVKILLLSP